MSSIAEELCASELKVLISTRASSSGAQSLVCTPPLRIVPHDGLHGGCLIRVHYALADISSACLTGVRVFPPKALLSDGFFIRMPHGSCVPTQNAVDRGRL
jgi:hypothetical protein